MPYFLNWEPLPPRARPGVGQRIVAGLLLGVAVCGAGVTWIAWRADAADARGDYARAVWWRPGVPMYHRQLGELNLMVSPRAAEEQLLEALRLDPYNDLATADITTVELALGNWPRAVAITSRQTRLEPGFDDHWRLANLYLSHGDKDGFWQETTIAARYAKPENFRSIAVRALASTNRDFARLRTALPPESAAAASAYLSTALQFDDRAAALDGLGWVAALPVSGNVAGASARRQAMLDLYVHAWRTWPDDVERVGQQLQAAGILDTVKNGRAPYLLDGSFSPGQDQLLARNGANMTEDLRPVLGWQWSSQPGVRYYAVYTGNTQHPTAAEFIFDGTESEDIDLTRQWILSAGGVKHASAWVRRLDDSPSNGLSLRIATLDGRQAGAIELKASGDWMHAVGDLELPASATRAWQVSLHYHRLAGEVPLRGSIAVSGVSIE